MNDIDKAVDRLWAGWKRHSPEGAHRMAADSGPSRKKAGASTGHGTGVIQTRTIGSPRRFHLWPQWAQERNRVANLVRERKIRTATEGMQRKAEAAERARVEALWYNRLGRWLRRRFESIRAAFVPTQVGEGS